MLHNISISNYQSIRERVELDFRIPGTSPAKSGFRPSHSRSDIRLPTVIALYGPNGSGKTTLLRGFMSTLRFVADSFLWTSSKGELSWFPPFLSSSSSSSPTHIEIEFDAQFPFKDDIYRLPQLCRYTLTIERNGLNDNSGYVAYEAIHTFPKGRPRRLMERTLNDPVFLSTEFEVGAKDPRLSVVPDSASAISTLARMQVGIFPQIVQTIQSVGFNIAGPDPWILPDDTLIEFYRDNPKIAEEVTGKLRRFDLGIEEMRVEKIKQTGEWILVFDHRGFLNPVPFIAESSGTRHIVRLFPQLNSALNHVGLAVIDALDNDFHTELVLEILNWFRRKDTNPNDAQLICSLHNCAALDELEKDEVFIVKKSRDGATTSYGAKDITGLRRDTNLQRQYRSGVLGGVPTFG